MKLTDDTATASMINPVTSGQAGDGEVFALTGTSDPLPPNALPGEGDGFAVVDLAAVGVRTLNGVLQFAVNTHNHRAHPNAPGNFQIFLDVTGDGAADYLVLNWDLEFPINGIGDGRNVTWFIDLETGVADAWFFTDANLNSSNTIMTVPLAGVGLSEGSQFTCDVLGVDLYFAGEATDAITGMTYTVGTPKYASDPTITVPALGVAQLGISAVDGGAEASPSQSGVLVLWRDGMQGKEASVIQVS